MHRGANEQMLIFCLVELSRPLVLLCGGLTRTTLRCSMGLNFAVVECIKEYE